jgi:hypothetical protein
MASAPTAATMQTDILGCGATRECARPHARVSADRLAAKGARDRSASSNVSLGLPVRGGSGTTSSSRLQPTHRQVSGYFSSKQPFTGGQTVRQWLSAQSYARQQQFARQVMERFGGMCGQLDMRDATVNELVSRYVEAAVAHREASELGDHKRAIPQHDIVAAAYRELRARGEEQALLSLLSHDDPGSSELGRCACARVLAARRRASPGKPRR